MSGDQSVGGYQSLTVVLAVGLAATLAVLVVIVVVVIVRHFRASRRKTNTVDRQQAPSSGGPAHVGASMSSLGFESINSKFSVASDASVDDQLLS